MKCILLQIFFLGILASCNKEFSSKDGINVIEVLLNINTFPSENRLIHLVSINDISFCSKEKNFQPPSKEGNFTAYIYDKTKTKELYKTSVIISSEKGRADGIYEYPTFPTYKGREIILQKVGGFTIPFSKDFAYIVIKDSNNRDINELDKYPIKFNKKFFGRYNKKEECYFENKPIVYI